MGEKLGIWLLDLNFGALKKILRTSEDKGEHKMKRILHRDACLVRINQ